MTDHDDDDIDYSDSPCYWCEGEGWYWDGRRKRVCPKCHGKGTGGDDE
jgi:DnaJ-class molecular chaperone